MMPYGNMMGYGGMAIFGLIIPLLVTVLLVLGIAALWKYITKK